MDVSGQLENWIVQDWDFTKHVEETGRAFERGWKCDDGS